MLYSRTLTTIKAFFLLNVTIVSTNQIPAFSTYNPIRAQCPIKTWYCQNCITLLFRTTSPLFPQLQRSKALWRNARERQSRGRTSPPCTSYDVIIEFSKKKIKFKQFCSVLLFNVHGWLILAREVIETFFSKNKSFITYFD